MLQQSQGGVAYTTSGAESTLTILSVGESDGGVYQCVATQPATGRQAASNEFLNPKSRIFTHTIHYLGLILRYAHAVIVENYGGAFN